MRKPASSQAYFGVRAPTAEGRAPDETIGGSGTLDEGSRGSRSHDVFPSSCGVRFLSEDRTVPSYAPMNQLDSAAVVEATFSCQPICQYGKSHILLLYFRVRTERE
jgi:hypothetical protein